MGEEGGEKPEEEKNAPKEVAPPCCPSFLLTYDPSSEARTLGQGRVGRPPRESSGIFGNRRIRGSREFRHGAPPCCPLLEPSNSRGSSSRQQQQQQQQLRSLPQKGRDAVISDIRDALPPNASSFIVLVSNKCDE
ncbi:hypothetical protein V1477_002053 [Vespula maculifrons]|uniref:Uncharacterized protein n=1 Tax=Vespula maculifrons TaxID=7453 RepID=A0ABD2CXX0_VESMC